MKTTSAKPAAVKPAGATSGAGGDKSNTKTRTATSTVANPHTQTSTEAYTQGNITVTGGAGKGATIVHIGGQPSKPTSKTGTSKVGTVNPGMPKRAVMSSGSSHTSRR